MRMKNVFPFLLLEGMFFFLACVKFRFMPKQTNKQTTKQTNKMVQQKGKLCVVRVSAPWSATKTRGGVYLLAFPGPPPLCVCLVFLFDASPSPLWASVIVIVCLDPSRCSLLPLLLLVHLTLKRRRKHSLSID